MDINNKNGHNNIDEKSGSEMLSEIMRLLMKLLLKGFTKLCRAIVKGCRLLLKLIKRGLIALMDFWNDKSTQEKVHSFKLWLIKALKQTLKTIGIILLFIGKLLLAALLLTGRGLLKLAVMTAHGLTHLKPTLIFIKDLTVKMFIAIGNGFTAMGRGIGRQGAKMKASYTEFRKTKGFKGLLIDIKNSLQTRLNNYIEEEENSETSTEALSYEEYVAEDSSEEKKGLISWWVSFCTKVNKALDVIIGSE